MRRLREELRESLSAAVPGLGLNGHASLRLPNTLNVRFPGVSGTAILDGAPEVAASTGSACHAGGERPSAVIVAMGVPPEAAVGSVRLSLGYGTTREQIAVASAALAATWRRLLAERAG